MPRHEVKFSVRERSIENRDVVFKVFSDEQRLGDLYISRGGVDWRPRSKQSAHYKFNWEKFAQLIEQS